MRSPSTFDCVIVGGGPAGAALAWLLAQSAFRVLLVDAGNRPGGTPRETLLAEAGGALERAGLAQLVAAAASPDARRHGAIWGEDRLVWRDQSQPGWLLQRGPFDAALLTAAERCGVEVRRRSRVLGPLPVMGAGELQIAGPDRATERIVTDRIVLATGKRVPRDLVTIEAVARGPETAALTLTADCAAAARLAIVEAVASGWWWWIGDGGQGGTATLLCDVDELTAVGTRALLERARREARGPVRELVRARLAYATRTTARSVQTADRVLLLGDAAATIDPLASQGVEKALLGADHTAAALRSAREHADWWSRLCVAHRCWEHGLYEAHGLTAASFLGREQRFGSRPFWAARARSPAVGGASNLQPARWLRAAEVTEQPVLERFGASFREVGGARHCGTGETRATVGHVPVVPLLRAFARPVTLAEGTALAGRDPRLFVLAPQAVADAAIALHQRGWLTASPST